MLVPLVRWTETQAKFLGLLGPPTSHSKDGLEEKHQVGRIHPWDLCGNLSEVEARDMTDNTVDGVDCVLATECRGLGIELVI